MSTIKQIVTLGGFEKINFLQNVNSDLHFFKVQKKKKKTVFLIIVLKLRHTN